MANRIFTFVIGVVYLALGICAMVPAFKSLPPSVPEYQTPLLSIGYGYLFGSLSVNILTAVTLGGLGALGILSAATLMTARLYSQLLFFVALMMLFTGLTPGVNSMFGLMPIYEWMIAVFLLTSLFSFYFAFIEGPKSKFWSAPLLPQ